MSDRQKALMLDMPRYTSEAPCKRCGTLERFTRNGACVQCQNDKRQVVRTDTLSGSKLNSINVKLTTSDSKFDELRRSTQYDAEMKRKRLQLRYETEVADFKREVKAKLKAMEREFDIKMGEIDGDLERKLNRIDERHSREFSVLTAAREAAEARLAEQEARLAEQEARQQAYLADPVRLRKEALSRLYEQCRERATVWDPDYRACIIQLGGHFQPGNLELLRVIAHFKEHFPEWQDITPDEYWDNVIKRHHRGKFSEKYKVTAPYFGDLTAKGVHKINRNMMFSAAEEWFKSGDVCNRVAGALYQQDDGSYTESWMEAIESYK